MMLIRMRQVLRGLDLGKLNHDGAAYMPAGVCMCADGAMALRHVMHSPEHDVHQEMKADIADGAVAKCQSVQ